jgi:hypothetical protein
MSQWYHDPNLYHHKQSLHQQPHHQPIDPQIKLYSDIRRSINTYFSGLKFVKLDKSNNHFSMYGVCISSGLSKDIRYVIAISQQDQVPIWTHLDISQIPWNSIQTRTLEEDWGLKDQAFDTYKYDKEDPILNSTINVYKNTYQHAKYKSSQLPLEIILLVNPNYNNRYQYADELTIKKALDTFNCCLTIS